MRTIGFIIALFAVLSSFGIDRAEAEQLISAANSLYEEGKVTEAIEVYESVSAEFTSKQLEFNLGNAYYRDRQIPLAILHFERALRFAPQDEAILHNLRTANLLTVDKIEDDKGARFSQWWTSKLLAVGPGKWASLSVVLSMIMLLCAGIYFFMRSRSLKRFGFLVGLFAAALTLVFLWFSISSKGALLSTSEGIIITPKVEVVSAPNKSATELFILHEGTKVEILRKSENWFNIKLGNGKVGWLEGTDVVVI